MRERTFYRLMTALYVGMLVGTAGTIVTYGVAKIHGRNITPERERVRTALYGEISERISDRDGKPGTSFDDWAGIYIDALNRPLNPLSDDPARSSLEDLSTIEQFLDNQ